MIVSGQVLDKYYLLLEKFTRPLAKILFINSWDGQDAHPTRKNKSCGMGILPVLIIFARGSLIMEI
jgi:hypothetical protein